MLKAIETKWFGPGARLGSRIKAIARKREGVLPEISLTDSWDWGTAPEGNHTRVAKLLATKLGWVGLWVGGASAEGYCFVLVETIARDAVASNMRGIENQDWFVVREVQS